MLVQLRRSIFLIDAIVVTGRLVVGGWEEPQSLQGLGGDPCLRLINEKGTGRRPVSANSVVITSVQGGWVSNPDSGAFIIPLFPRLRVGITVVLRSLTRLAALHGESVQQTIFWTRQARSDEKSALVRHRCDDEEPPKGPHHES